MKNRIRKLVGMVIYPNEKQPKGCLIVNKAVELSLLNQEVDEKVTETFIKTETLLFDLLKRGQEPGEIPKYYDIKELSKFIHNSLVGIRVLAKTTDDKKELETIIDLTLSTLD
ncbi:TetR family transcriptional regulator C-terminal domain-containing protein [Priestia megaterium]|uniref:TetR family transcriptional regulator C-terminal domain-containing protein n=1 Tax=Priestia megaterium TaxID=1404 RepID=UPI0015DD2ED7|nr:TetR family transcriptional regulator C-terminal domain-containing protein [Priestia megaterium]QLK05360.1 Transcriptional regulator, TetR family [Priestia megaterium]